MPATDDDVDDMPEDVQEAIEVADEIETTIDGLPDEIQIRGSDFFEDVQEKAKDVKTTILKTGRVTARQRAALDNWLAGVKKWIRD